MAREDDEVVLELYCGIGGLHQAYRMSGGRGRVVAYDINDVASRVYELNFGSRVLRSNLETVSPAEIDSHRASLWLMSPPCQPFNDSVMSKKRDMDDPRSLSLRHMVLDVLPALRHKPRRILLENVKGFQGSVCRELVVGGLQRLGFSVLERLVSPVQLGIPNQRLRYFLLASLGPLSADLDSFLESGPACDLPLCAPCHRGLFVRNYLEMGGQLPLVPQRVVLGHGLKFDIVARDSLKTCCFTKGYTKIVEGTGSVLATSAHVATQEQLSALGSIQDASLLVPLQLRYFTPREIARLHGFPDTFLFPQSVSVRALYRLLGNSLNCVVVSHLLAFLLSR